jgi:hypothetical protein
MTLTEQKLEANRQNAHHSTGPRTEAGKARAARNATTHGLTSHTILLPGESVPEFQALLKAMLEGYDRFTPAETALVLDLVDFEWRLRRASRFEAKILSAEAPDYKALNNMSIHQARIKRQFSATLKELLEVQKHTRDEYQFQVEAAETIARADNILKRPPTHDRYGFDFTFEELQEISGEYDGYRKAQDILARCKDPELVRYASIQYMKQAA